MRLFDFIELLVQWESTTDEQVLETARHLIRLATDGNPPPLLDPFAGGGSIPLEAQRLGLEAHASDLNPVAVMINKAMIEIPPKFSNRPPVNSRDRAGTAQGGSWKGAAGLAADVRYYGEWMRDRAWERIGHLYPTHNGETVIAWIWARSVKSSNPAVNAYVPLVKSFELAQKKGDRRIWIQPRIQSDRKGISFEIHTGDGSPPPGTMERHGATCLISGVPITYDYIRSEAQEGRLSAQLMTIVTLGNRKRNYYPPSVEHEEIARSARPTWYPDQDLEGKLTVSVPLYGMRTFADLFTARQLVALTTFSDLAYEAKEVILADAKETKVYSPELYADAIISYLGLAASKSSDNNSTMCTWMPGAKYEVVRNSFARQALAMTWDYAESNPFAGSSGDLLEQIYRISTVLETAMVDRPERGIAVQRNAIETPTNQKLLTRTEESKLWGEWW
jgi:putative DNA methylase